MRNRTGNGISSKLLPIALLAAAATVFAQPPLPGLRVEPISGGTVFYVKNTASQPLAAFILELDGYPGGGYVFVHDESSGGPIAPGSEERIQSASMTPGAAPDYMKIEAAIYADGSSAGKPEKVAQLVDHRRVMLETDRGLIGRIEKAKAGGAQKAAAVADLKQWAESIPQPVRRERFRAAGVNQTDTRALIEKTAAQLDAGSFDEVLAGLHAAERALAASKPPL